MILDFDNWYDSLTETEKKEEDYTAPDDSNFIPSAQEPNSNSVLATTNSTGDSIIIEAQYKDKILNLLVDTGSGVNILRKDSLAKDAKISPATTKLTSISGHQLQITGFTTLPMKIGEKQANLDFHVSNVPLSSHLDGLIGRKTLQELNVILNLRTKTYSFEKSSPETAQVNYVRLIEDIKFKPGQESLLTAKVTDSKGNILPQSNPTSQFLCIHDTLTRLRNGIVGANSLSHISAESNVLIRLLNLNSCEVLLKADTVVGHISEVFQEKEEKIATIEVANQFPVNQFENSAESQQMNGENEKEVILPGPRGEKLDLEEATKGVPEMYRGKLKELISEFQDIFAQDDWQIGKVKDLEFSIEVGNAAPIHTKPYPIPYALREDAQKCIDKLLNMDIIEEAQSPWCSPVLIVKSKSKPRLVIDFRNVNKVIRQDRFPLTPMREIIDSLHGSKVFSLLDQKLAFHQAQLSKESRDITAFAFNNKQYAFKRVPFGLSLSSSFYSRCMAHVLKDLGKYALSYLDDLICHSATYEQHLEHLRYVFEAIRNSGMLLNLKKCKLMLKEVPYLGSIINEHGSKPCPEKIKAIVEYPRPTTQKELLSTLGLFSYYRRHVEGFSKIAAPLFDLTSRRTNSLYPDVKNSWGERQEIAFQELKHRLCNAPILAFPNWKLPFILSTDSSNTGMGSILSQKDETGKEYVIAYASRRLTPSETRFSTIELEMGAIMAGISQFKPYLYGRKFVLLVDNKALLWLRSMSHHNAKLFRWSLKLEEYDFTVCHRSTKQHCNVDALSRNFPEPVCSTEEQLIIDENSSNTNLRPIINRIQILEEQALDPNLKPILQKLQNGQMDEVYVLQSDGILCRRTKDSTKPHQPEKLQVMLPRNLVTQVLKQCHNYPFGLHYSTEKTLKRLQEQVYWTGMAEEVKKFCESCLQCKTSRFPNKKPLAPLQHKEIATHPFSIISLDLAGPLQTSLKGNRYILVIVDHLTRFTIACPMKGTSAEETAQLFVSHVIYKYGIVDSILTDRGSNFTSQLFKHVCKILGITQLLTTSYHLQANGLVERTNRSIAQLLRASLGNADLSTWDDLLDPLVFLFNTTKNRTTGFTPYFLLYGREANVNFHDFECTRPFYGETLPYNEFLPRILTKAHKAAREAIRKGQEQQKVYRAPRESIVSFKPGDLVLVKRERFPIGQPHKLFSRYVGPFKVLKFVPPGNLTIESKKRTPLRIHSDRVIPYKPLDTSDATLPSKTLSQSTDSPTKPVSTPDPVTAPSIIKPLSNSHEPEIIWNDSDAFPIRTQPVNIPTAVTPPPPGAIRHEHVPNTTPLRRSQRIRGNPANALPHIMNRPIEWANRLAQRMSPQANNQ